MSGNWVTLSERYDTAIPAAVAGYFGIAPDNRDSRYVDVVEAFFPDMGEWIRVQPGVATIDRCARLKREGASAVAVRYGTRIADFQIGEVTP